MKERTLKLAIIAERYPELFQKLQTRVGETTGSMTQHQVWEANECIFQFCLTHGLRYPDLALLPDFL